MSRPAIRPLMVFLVLSLLLFTGLELISASGQSAITEPATKINLSDGRWSDATIWSDGALPNTGDIVKIASGSQVEYDVFSEVEIAELTIGGSLLFSRTISTNLDVGDIFVESTGYLEISTELDRIP